MADWTNIADSALDPDAPLTSELAYAWRDNTIAVAEGAPGSPRIAHRAITPLYLGGSNGNGAAYSFTLTGTENIGMVMGWIDATIPSGDQLIFQASTDGGSSWGAVNNMILGSDSVNGMLMLNLVTGAWRITPDFSGTVTIPSGMNAFRIKPDGGAGSDFIISVMAWAAGGIID